MRRNNAVHGSGVAIPWNVPKNQLSGVEGSGRVRVWDGDSTGESLHLLKYLIER